MKIPIFVLCLTSLMTLPLHAEVPRTVAHQGRIAVDGVNFTGNGEFKFRLYTAASALDPAQAVATVSGGKVTAITVVHGGSGYAAAPTVAIGAPKGGGTTATATAVISGQRVTSITVTSGGSGYVVPPQVEVALAGGVIMSNRWSNSIGLALPGMLSLPPVAVSVPVTNGLYSIALGDTALPNMAALPADLTPPPDSKMFLRIWFKSVPQSDVFEELLPHQALESVPYALHARTADALLGALPPEDGFLVAGGPLNAGNIPAQGKGARMMWFSAERAFRVGEITDLALFGAGIWDEPQIGRYSIAMGVNPLASGYASLSVGEATEATGSHAMALGWNTEASGIAAFAAGQGNTASGGRSFAVGQNSQALHDHSAAIGYELRTGRTRQTVVGAWNTITPDAYFVVGGGTDNGARKNVMTVDGDGDVGSIRHVTASGFGQFSGNLVTQSNLTVAGSAVVAGNVLMGGTVQMTNDVTVKTLTITGGADLAEPFDLADPSLEPGTVVVIDDAHPGRLTQSTNPYDTRVAGIISGAGGIQPGLSLEQKGINSGGRKVALTGRVYVSADAGNGPIVPGDLLTTSGTPGHAMKVKNGMRAQGAILGKAMSGLKEGRGLVLVLVTLQ